MSKSSTATGATAALGLDVERPTKVILVHPVTGQDLVDKADKTKVAFVEVYSADSKRADQARKTIRLARMRSRNPNKVDHEQEAADLLAALSVSWYLVDFDGNAIDLVFNVENAAELYAAPETRWLTDQVDTGAGDRGNFMKASSQS